MERYALLMDIQSQDRRSAPCFSFMCTDTRYKMTLFWRVITDALKMEEVNAPCFRFDP